jgi:hypothetical protein
LLTFGERWHNNHHAHPQSARHGLAWYEFDPNWYGICALQAIGLASNVKARTLENNRLSYFMVVTERIVKELRLIFTCDAIGLGFTREKPKETC